MVIAKETIRLRELLEYDPATGIFTWRVDRGRTRAGERWEALCWVLGEEMAA